VRSGRLVAWTRAWQAGLASYDEVLDSTRGGDRSHRVTGAAGDLTLGGFLLEVRRVVPGLVLPVPGDPRGLPGPGPFTDHALSVGEAVLAGTWGLVPEIRQVGGAAGPVTTVDWHSYPVPVSVPEQVPVADAEHDLSDAIRETATALTRLDVARYRPELAAALADLRRPATDVALPPGYPARAHRLLALADRITTILRLAAIDAPGAAVTANAAVLRDDLLRPVATAARRARLAAYNAGVSG
jgi:hypothetical protein